MEPQRFSWVCFWCCDTFGELPDCLKHQSSHATKDTEGHQSASPTGIQQRRQHHLGPKERRHRCSVCPRTFNLGKNLTQHSHTHTDVHLYHCTVCWQTFSQSASCSRHKRTHEGQRFHRCSTCQRVFGRADNLARHELTHAPAERAPHCCTACPRRFTRADHLAAHARVHTGEKPYRCSVCERAFARSDTLAKHTRSVHKGSEFGASKMSSFGKPVDRIHP